MFLFTGTGGAESGDPGMPMRPRDKKVLWIFIAIITLFALLLYFYGEGAEGATATFFWFSFRDSEENLNLGITVVKAEHKAAAHKMTHQLGLNPGGEALIIELTDEQFEQEDLKAHRLYTRQEMIDLGYMQTNRTEET